MHCPPRKPAQTGLVRSSVSPLSFHPPLRLRRRRRRAIRSPSIYRRLVNVANTILGSVKDLFCDLMNPLTKRVVTALGEVLYLLGGRFDALARLL